MQPPRGRFYWRVPASSSGYPAQHCRQTSSIITGRRYKLPNSNHLTNARSRPPKRNGTCLSSPSPRPRPNTIESGHGIHRNHGNKRQKSSVPSVFSVAIYLTLAKVTAIAPQGWRQNNLIACRVDEPLLSAALHLFYHCLASTRGTAAVATLKINQPFRPTGTKILGSPLAAMF